MGLYGLCEKCGRPIEAERLAVLAIPPSAVSAPSAGGELTQHIFTQTPAHSRRLCMRAMGAIIGRDGRPSGCLRLSSFVFYHFVCLNEAYADRSILHVLSDSRAHGFRCSGQHVGASKLYPQSVPVLPRQINRNLEAFLAEYHDLLPFVCLEDLPKRRVDHVIAVDTQTVQPVRA